MKKKLLTILLTLVMVLAMIPMTSGVAFGGETAPTEVSDEAALTKALANQAPVNIKLTDGFKITSKKDISKEVTIDLNGFTICQYDDFEHLFIIGEGGKLTITDSSNGLGEISVSVIGQVTGERIIFKVNGGELVINNGKFTVSGNDRIVNCVNVYAGSAIINGGNFGISTTHNSSSVVACTKKYGDKESVLNINGGTFNGNGKKSFASYKDSNPEFGTVNIKGGVFIGTLSTDSSGNIPFVHITGGVFSQNTSKNGASAPRALSEIIEDGCVVVTLDTDPVTYQVRKLYPETWEPYFETLALRIAAQAEVEAAKMLEDAKVTVKEEEPVAQVIEIAQVKSEQAVAPNGKNSVKVTWVDEKCEGYDIYRAANNEEYKFMFNTTNDYYYNTLIRAGQKYSYKVKGYNTVDGEKVYTDFSTETTCIVK